MEAFPRLFPSSVCRKRSTMSDIKFVCSYKEKKSKLKRYHVYQANFVSYTFTGLKYRHHMDKADFIHIHGY